MSLWMQLRKLFNLEVDNAKMLLTEKLTVLVARITVCAVTFVVGTCTLIFASMGVADILLENLPARWTYLIGREELPEVSSPSQRKFPESRAGMGSNSILPSAGEAAAGSEMRK